MEEQPRSGALAWALHDLAVAVAEADVAMSARLGVSAGDYLAIKHVLVRPGGLGPVELGPVELGRLLGMSSGSATSLVDRLERAGHLERGPHATDRRRRVLVVTEPTRRAVEAALAPLGAAVDELGAACGPGERAAVERCLRAAADLHRAFGRAEPR